MLGDEGCQVAVVARTQKHIDRAVAGLREAGCRAVGDQGRYDRTG